MTVHRALACLAIAALSILALSTPALSAQGDIRGVADWDWLSGFLMAGCFAVGAILGLTLSPALRTTAPDDYGRKMDSGATEQMLKNLSDSVYRTGAMVAELKTGMNALASQMHALQGDVNRSRHGNGAERVLNELSASMRDTDTTVAGLRDGLNALTDQVQALRSREPTAPRPLESRDRPAREIVPLSQGKAVAHSAKVTTAVGDPLAFVMDEYRQVMEDEELSDRFLERWQVLRATRNAAGTLEVVDTPTADLWAVPLGAGDRVLLLPSRRTLTRNFPALAANRGEGVRRDLGPLFDIEFADLEKPVVVEPAVAMLSGPQIRVTRSGHLRFPRQ